MEISGLSPYLTAPGSADAETQTGVSQETAGRAELLGAQAPAAQNRAEVVRTQNLASPAPEQVDIGQAATLLRQVTQRFSFMEHQDMHRLYQFDRLRDLCHRLQGGPEA